MGMQVLWLLLAPRFSGMKRLAANFAGGAGGAGLPSFRMTPQA